MRVLFVCNQNTHRSKTAEKLFRDRFKTKSAGLFNENPITEKELDWADKVIVMENEQRKEISKRFPEQYLKKQILSLNIPDIFHFNQPKLIELLNLKVNNLF